MSPAVKVQRILAVVGTVALMANSIPAEARPRHKHRHTVVDANGNGVVRSKSGIAVRVNPSARAALQCVVDYVEGAGVRITAMRGYGPGTVRHSLHPSGRALDINQTSRDVTSPRVPRSVSNAAADRCGVISGARWGNADNGHWNLEQVGRRRAFRAEAIAQ